MNQFKTYLINDRKLPLVIEPKNQFISFEGFLDEVRTHQKYLKAQLLDHGGLLFRNFAVNGTEAFNEVVKALNLGSFVNYIGGGSPRKKVKDSVYTSTEAPPGIKIHLHNEMSFADNFPKHIYFYCDIPPQEKGETFIGDSRAILKSVSEEVKHRFAEKKLKYISRYYYKSKVMDLMNRVQRGHKTWIDVFETYEKNEVEKKCLENNIGCKWNINDWLEISRIRPFMITHPETQEDVWFNQVHLFDYNPRFLGWWRYIGMRMFYFQRHMLVDEILYADNTKISRKDIYHIVDVLDEHAIYIPWKKGDVMVLDNLLTMHGRNCFKGPRKILAAMTK